GEQSCERQFFAKMLLPIQFEVMVFEYRFVCRLLQVGNQIIEKVRIWCDAIGIGIRVIINGNAVCPHHHAKIFDMLYDGFGVTFVLGQFFKDLTFKERDPFVDIKYSLLHLIFVVAHRSLCDECAELLIVKVHLLQAMVMPDKQSPKFPIEEQGIKNRGFHTYRFTIYSMQIRWKCKYRSIAIHAFLADQILRFYIDIWQIAVGYAFIILHKGSRHEYWRKLHIL